MFGDPPSPEVIRLRNLIEDMRRRQDDCQSMAGSDALHILTEPDHEKQLAYRECALRNKAQADTWDVACMLIGKAIDDVQAEEYAASKKVSP